MRIDSLAALLEKLNGGDPDAAEEAFRTYEPYLRVVVRRSLPRAMRSKFDSIDVVQSAYGDVVAAFRKRGMTFETVAQLQAFLVKATRNRLIDRLRQHRTALRLEQPLRKTSPQFLPQCKQPRPSETAKADELWDRLLALCPVEHQELLRLRRRGASTREIASEVGMHEGSVRRVLRELALRLACAAAPDGAGAVP